MNSTSQVERGAQRERPTRAKILGERLRRLVDWRPTTIPLRPHARKLARRVAPVRYAVERALRIGVIGRLPIDTQKRIRLCNVMALGGTIIMAVWAYTEASFGDHHNLPWEVGFMATFLAVLVLNGSGAHRAARLLLVVNANVCVLAGALLFTASSGGILPFFGLAAVALLLFGPEEWGLTTLGALLPALLFASCKIGFASDLLGITPRPAPDWYFAANAVTTFGLAFLVPFFFFRSNVKAEASLQRLGQEKLKRLLDADLIGVVRGRVSGRIEDANDTFLALLGYTRQDLAAGTLDLRMLAPLEPYQSELAAARLRSTNGAAAEGRQEGADPGRHGLPGRERRRARRLRPRSDGAETRRGPAHDAARQSGGAAVARSFNWIASDELKTPLTALLLNLELLGKRLDKEVPDGSPLRARVERCESAAVRMGELIDALLDVARIHRGRFTLDVRETDVVAAVRKVVGGFEAGVGERIGAIESRCAPTER